jgi:hypothetical protein
LAGHATELPVVCVVVCFQLGKLIFRQGDALLLPWPPRAPTLVLIRSISSKATISVVKQFAARQELRNILSNAVDHCTFIDESPSSRASFVLLDLKQETSLPPLGFRFG